jgi:hypothetical protein
MNLDADEPKRAELSSKGSTALDSRLNFHLLRTREATCPPPSSRLAADQSPLDRPITRRLALKTGALASVSRPLTGALLSGLGGRIEFVFDGRQAVFMRDGRASWTIDPSRFSGQPRLAVEEDARTVRVRLQGARLPGTSVPADLRCRVSKGRLAWTVQLDLGFGGFRCEGELEPWLAGETAFAAPVNWQGFLLEAGQGVSVAVEGCGRARFLPNWTLSLTRLLRGRASIEGVALPTDRIDFGLANTDHASLARRPEPRRTRFEVDGSGQDWSAIPRGRSLRGGSLEVEPAAFERLDIESHEGLAGRQIFYLATSETGSTVATFRPGSAFRSSAGEVAAFPLRDLRIAGAIGPDGAEHATVANQADIPIWLDAGTARLRLGDVRDDSVLEVVQRTGEEARFKFAPALLSSVTPLEGALSVEAEPHSPTRVAFHEDAGNLGAGENCGTCTSPDGQEPELALPRHVIGVLRPEDLLVARFELVNLEIRKCWLSKPRLVRTRPQAAAFIVVHLPPQHVAEKAFEQTPKTDELPRIADMESRIANESRLVFRLQDQVSELPFDLATLLDWRPEVFCPVKVPAERLRAEIKPPGELETDIEFPWRLHISPDACCLWSHSAEPVTRGGRTELWHSRLTADPTAGLAGPTIRAVWSDCEPPAPPFRTSLTDADRRLIVQATHEKETSPLPVEAHLLALSSLGAWADFFGEWPCIPARACNPLEKWTHVAAMGRDHKVVVERRGFLCPTGHKANYVTETTRELQKITFLIDGRQRRMCIAFLRQRFYVKVKEPTRPYGNWDMPHRVVEILDQRTPFLNNPCEDGGGSILDGHGQPWGQKAFWPTVGDQVFQFRLRGVDYAGSQQNWLEPLIFVEQSCDDAVVEPCSSSRPASAACSTTTVPTGKPPDFASSQHLRDAAASFRSSPRRSINLSGQTVAMAPSLRKGDTEVAVRQADLSLTLLSELPTNSCVAGYLAPDSAALKLHKDPCEPPFWPRVEAIEASVPAVEAFLGASKSAKWTPLAISCDDTFETFALLKTKGDTKAEFQNKTDRSGGGLGPSPNISHLSRRFGPVGLGDARKAADAASVSTVPPAAVPAGAPPPGPPQGADFFDVNATLLGTIHLTDIIRELNPADGSVPALLSLLTPYADGPDFLQQSFVWETTSLKPLELGILAFEPKPETTFKIDGSFSLWVGQPETANFKMVGSLESFAVRIGLTSAGARIPFNKLTYTAGSDGKTSFAVDLGEVQFLGILAFIDKLAQELKKFLNDAAGVEIDLQPSGLVVWMPPINLHEINFGIIAIRNLNIRSWARLPFSPAPVEFGFSFGRSDAPCELSVGIFGGRAYVLAVLDTATGGLRRFEASFEFGALREISFGPAHGRVYILGGVFYGIASDGTTRTVVLKAFVRAGGSVDILGLISAYIDLYIGLRYEDNGTSSFLVGEASLVYGFKIVLISYSVTLRRTERLAGSDTKPSSGGSFQFRSESLASLAPGAQGGLPAPETSPPRFEEVMPYEEWSAYWDAFGGPDRSVHAA